MRSLHWPPAKGRTACWMLSLISYLFYPLSLKETSESEVNRSLSTWKEIKIGAPQGSVLGPLLFNEFMNDIFLFVRYTNICNYADDTTIFACLPILETIVRQLETDGAVLAKWFSDNYLK